MPFCTLLVWEKDFDFGVYDALNERTGATELPDGCLVRIVGAVDTGARVVEVWKSQDHARRFSEATMPAITDLKIPPPDRVEAFETTAFVSG